MPTRSFRTNRPKKSNRPDLGRRLGFPSPGVCEPLANGGTRVARGTRNRSACPFHGKPAVSRYTTLRAPETRCLPSLSSPTEEPFPRDHRGLRPFFPSPRITTALGLWYPGSMGPTHDGYNLTDSYACRFCHEHDPRRGAFCCQGLNYGTREDGQFPPGSFVGVMICGCVLAAAVGHLFRPRFPPPVLPARLPA